ncbi:MAG: hypothetical protein R3F33_13175 [Planctomycetota bacterium]
MFIHKQWLVAGLVLALGEAALGQGDSCAFATTISGTGTWSFDNTWLTTSGFDGAGFCGLGASTVTKDGFYQWIVPTTGDYQFDTYGSSFDTKLSIHLGIGCAATCSGYNDDTGSLQSEVRLQGLNAGQQVLIQVGSFAGDYGPGGLHIGPIVDPCMNPADDLFEENDDCSSAAVLADGTYPNLFVSQSDPDHFAVCILSGDTINLSVLHSQAQGDIDAFLWEASDPHCGAGLLGLTSLIYGYSSTDDEVLTWTNNTGATVNAVLEVNVKMGSPSPCNTYDLMVSGSGGCGTPSYVSFCDPMNPNSTGQPTVISAAFATGVGSGLHLEAAHGPPTQFGYFLVGTGFSEPGLNFGNGRLCLAVGAGSQIGRYNVAGALNSVGQFNASGVLMNFVGTSTVGSGYDVPSNLPLTGNPSIASGDTWYFQLWHREAAGQSNFSNGIIVTFP